MRCKIALFLFLSLGPAAWAATFEKGRVLVKFREGADRFTQEESARRVRATGQRALAQGRWGRHFVLTVPEGREEDALNALRQDPDVEMASLDRIVRPVYTPNDPLLSGQWHLPTVSAPQAWDAQKGNSQVVIAVLDTGVSATHPDLAERLVPGRNIYDNNSFTTDVAGHGTAVAGTAAASGDNGLGGTGVAYRCALMPVRISNLFGSSSLSLIIDGMEWAVDHGASVLNISFGPLIDEPFFEEAAAHAAGRGAVTVVAAGNSAYHDPTPALRHVIVASATDDADALAWFTNTGPAVTVAAPGVDVLTTDWGGGYGAVSGTSFSSPLTAGVVALIRCARPELPPTAVRTVLTRSADDLGPPGFDDGYGHGRVNAAAAVALAQTLPADATPPTVTFTAPGGGAPLSGTVPVTVTATDASGLSFLSVWVDGTLLAEGAESPLSLAWDTTAGANGAHTLQAVAEDGWGLISSATLTVQVDNPASLRTSPSSFALSDSTATAPSAALNITNQTDGSLMPWTVSANVPWLFFSSTAGVNGARVTVTPLFSGLAAGAHTGALTVTAPGALNSPRVIPVTLTLAAAHPPDTQPPTRPAQLAARALSLTQIELTWSPSWDNEVIAGYRVFRNGMSVGDVRRPPFTDGALAPYTTHAYTVAAFDAAGNWSSAAGPVSARTQDPARPDAVRVFPNPARDGQNPVLHFYLGPADEVDLRIYNAAGGLVHAARLPVEPADGAPSLNYEWAGAKASGVYTAVAVTRAAGRTAVHKTRFAVVR